LSMLLIKELYCLRDIVLYPLRLNKVLISLITAMSIGAQYKGDWSRVDSRRNLRYIIRLWDTFTLTSRRNLRE